MFQRLIRRVKDRNFYIPEPNMPSSVMFFFGGLAVCVGRAVLVDVTSGLDALAVATFFTDAGLFILGFGFVAYLFGWYR